jgi:ABC-type phosphate transport system substrate-binding protein
VLGGDPVLTMPTAAALLSAAALLFHPGIASGEQLVLAVVVHPSRADHLNVGDLERIYLRKRRFWNDGSPIVPLNREPGSAAREVFSAQVLRADGARLQAYWNEQYFQGVFPPTTLSSGAAVKRYVATDPRAVGYIDAREVDASVRTVATFASDVPAVRAR